MKQEMIGWHMQIICTLLQTDNLASTSLLAVSMCGIFGYWCWRAYVMEVMSHCSVVTSVVTVSETDTET